MKVWIVIDDDGVEMTACSSREVADLWKAYYIRTRLAGQGREKWADHVYSIHEQLVQDFGPMDPRATL